MYPMEGWELHIEFSQGRKEGIPRTAIRVRSTKQVAMATNAIAINLFAQVDQDGQRFVLFDEIIDWRTDGSQIKSENKFIHISNGSKRRHEKTKGWEVCIQWKDGSST